MLKAKRLNVILRINDNQADYYVSKGYTVYTEDGTVVKVPEGNDIELLKKQNDAYVKEIALLKEEIAKLKAEKEVEQVVEQVVEVEDKPEEEIIEKQPKKNKRK